MTFSFEVETNLEKDGFVFMGWYEEDSCETRYATNASNKQIIADGTTGSKTVCAYFLTTQLLLILKTSKLNIEKFGR